MEDKTNLIFNFRVSKVAAVILGFFKAAGSQVRQAMQAAGMIVYRRAVKGVEQERSIDEGDRSAALVSQEECRYTAAVAAHRGDNAR